MEAQEIDCMNKKSTNATIHVRGSEITVIQREDEDYISLTDMVRNFEGGSALIEQWLKNKDTVLSLASGNNSTIRILIPPNSRELKTRPGATASTYPPKNGWMPPVHAA